MGIFRKYSDIDIAVELKDKKLAPEILGKILTKFENSALPYELDVVDLNSIDENFKKLINASLTQL